ncbi:hypothetical protein Tco_0340455 [Tanacetum coccineum]
MDQIKQLDEGAYDYLIQRNPNSWSRAFFEMERRCAAFENGISESFNRAIMIPRHKPIITVLEEIRLYIMQRLVAMNKVALSLEDRITPSIRKRLEILKEKQRMWELSGVPCVHAVASYLHVGKDLNLGVSHWGRGRGRGGSVNEASGSGMGGIDEANGSGMETSGGGTRDGRTSSRGGGTTSSGGRRGGGRGSRGVGSTRGGGMAGSSSMGILTAEEEYQVERDEEAFRECMQEQAREQAKIDVEQERHMLSIHNLPTQQSGVWVKDTTDVAEASMLEESIVDKGKGKESPADEASGTKRKRGRPPSHVDGIRIYHKNRGRSERIANMKLKKPFQFDKHGTGSTPEKAFDVDD